MKSILILLVFMSPYLYAQDYTQYYFLCQKAQVAHQNNLLKEADSLYNLAFSKQKGFPVNYENAFINYYQLTGEIDTNLFIKAASTGIPWRDLKYDFKQLKIKETHPFKKIYRKHKYKKTVRGGKIFWMLVRDQLRRSRFLSFLANKKADSINAVKLKKLLKKKPALFNRNKTSWATTNFLNVLLLHQEQWGNAKKLFYPIRKRVKQGKIAPSTIQSMIERAAVYHGTSFTVDSKNQHLIVKENKYPPMCNVFHYSAIYGGLARFYKSKSGKQLLPPTAPGVSKQETNKLRNYVFLIDADVAFPKDKYTFLTKSEFCTKLKGN